jgi:O-antigen ligase
MGKNRLFESRQKRISASFPSSGGSPLSFWADRAFLGASSAVFFLAFFFGSFFGGMWAVAGIGGGIVLYLLAAIRLGRLPPLRKDLSILFGAFFLWCVATDWFATFGAVSWHMTLQLATIFVPILLFTSPSVVAPICEKPMSLFWPAVLAVALLLLALEMGNDAPLQQLMRPDDPKLPAYNRGFSYAMVVAWPLAAWIGYRKGWIYAVLFAAVLLQPFVLTLSRATQMGMVFAVGVFIAAWFMPRIVRWGLFGLSLAAMSWPFSARYIYDHAPDWVAKLPDSWRARMEIWDYVSYYIEKRPMLGWGVGSTFKLPPDSPGAASYAFTNIPASHPHNFLTEFWVELGMPGLVLIGVFLFITLKWAANLPSKLVPFALAAWALSFVLALCAYNFWTDSFLCMMALACISFAWVANSIDAKGSKTTH